MTSRVLTAEQVAEHNARVARYRLQTQGATAERTPHLAPVPYETDIVYACLQFLEMHPRVAWAVRMNTGGMDKQNADGSHRFIKFAFKGCSDILGQFCNGLLLAVEVKRPGKNLTDDQRAFLERVNRYHGVGFVARSVDDVATYLTRLT